MIKHSPIHTSQSLFLNARLSQYGMHGASISVHDQIASMSMDSA